MYYLLFIFLVGEGVYYSSDQYLEDSELEFYGNK